jgi:hypothetical protein
MKQIKLEISGKHPYNFETTDDASEWIQDRARLARAIGFETKQTDRMLYVLDKGEVLALYYYR